MALQNPRSHCREVGRRAGHERVRMAFCTFAMLDQRSWRVWSASAYCWTRSPKSGRRKMSMVISDSLIWKVCAYHAMKRSNDAFSETNVDICTAEVMRKRFSLLVRNLSGTRARAGVRCAASQGSSNETWRTTGARPTLSATDGRWFAAGGSVRRRRRWIPTRQT